MSGDIVVVLLHSHHLLDHKPDNLLLKGGKHKLRGVASLGRPGVALCIGSSTAVDNFRSSLESAMPQKKFGIIKLSNCPTKDLAKVTGFEQVTLGELRTLLATLGHEDQFFALTGLDPSLSSATNNSGGGATAKAGKRTKKKK